MKLTAITSICLLAVQALTSSNRVQALAVRSRKNAKKRSTSGGGSGFAPQVAVEPTATEISDDAVSKRAVSNLFSSCALIQNPQLYQPKWADACKLQEISKTSSTVIATRNVGVGQALTLFPIHALGLRTLRRNMDSKKKAKNRRDDTEFLAYDHDEDGELFKQDNQQAGLRIKLSIPLDDAQPASSVITNRRENVLFSMFVPDKTVVPGWLGGRMKSQGEGSNCITIPLPGAAPLCAVVATRDIKEGEEIIQASKPLEPKLLEELKCTVAKDYRKEISFLAQHISMACKSAAESRSNPVSKEVEGAQLGPFHQINQYQGLTQIHADPDIFVVENFLTNNECDKIIEKASTHLQPCLVNNEENGKVEEDPARTSTNANIPQKELPTVVQKLTDLTRCSPSQLEIIQVLNYKKGQEFIPHTDGFSGPFSACGFEQSTRLATIFCYLNDVEVGGETYFPDIHLDIKPRKGTAVIHFPADVKMREDQRTLHQGKPAIDEKWLLTTWVWQHDRSNGEYAESKLPPLSSEII